MTEVPLCTVKSTGSLRRGLAKHEWWAVL